MEDGHGAQDTLGLLRWFLRAPAAVEPNNNAHPVVQAAAARVRTLFERDTPLVVVPNALCPSYPPELLVPVGPSEGLASSFFATLTACWL